MTDITQAISSLSPVPDINDPATFETRTNALLTAALPTLRTEINAWSSQVNVVAGEINDTAAGVQANADTWSGALGAAYRWYPNPYSSHPTTRPDGSARQVGDKYWNMSDRLFYSWNGATWSSSDINTANLAAAGGAALIGSAHTGTGAANVDMLSRIRGTVMIPEDFGAAASPSVNDTTAFTNACARLTALGGGVLQLSFGKSYYLRDFVLPANILLNGCGASLHFFSSGNAAADASSNTVSWNGSHGCMMNVKVTGGYDTVGNGLLITPDSSGLKRLILNVTIEGFCAYSATAAARIAAQPPADATAVFGFRSNFKFRRDEITDDNGNHLLTGGNGLRATTSGAPAWELHVKTLNILGCEGMGADWDLITDSTLDDITIGDCMFRGWLEQGANNKRSGVKVYRCMMLNVGSNFATGFVQIIPHQKTQDPDIGAIVIAGRGHTGWMEVQECGSNGVALGYRTKSLNQSHLLLFADGNGGIDSPANHTANGTTAANFRRAGVMAFNYCGVFIEVNSDDFRAWGGYPRQKFGLQILSAGARSPVSTLGQVTGSSWYRITGNTGADFTPLQVGVAAPSNAIGTEFQARRTYPASPTATFGTGTLESVNDRSTFICNIHNQYGQDQGIDQGYSVAGDAGNSRIMVNGVDVQAPACADGFNDRYGTVTGTKHGTAATQKQAWWNATPVVQPASANQAAVSAPAAFGNADSEIGGLTIGAAYSQAEVTALRDKCEELADDCRALRTSVASYETLLTAIRSALVTTGLIKGAA